jgi:hypothetical protein
MLKSIRHLSERGSLMASQDSVVGPGWLQLGVSNCPFVTRTAVWVHCAGIRLSLEHRRPPARLRRRIGRRQGPFASRMEGRRGPSSSSLTARQGKLPPWQRGTNVWRGITNRGPSDPTRDWVRPMNPFGRWRDEPVSRVATERVTGRSMGAFAMKQSPVQTSSPSP